MHFDFLTVSNFFSKVFFGETLGILEDPFHVSFIYLFMELYCEDAVFGMSHELHQVGARNLFFGVEKLSTIHFVVEDVSAHGELCSAGLRSDDLNIVFVSDTLDLVIRY